ncbi:DUF6364 family protein [Mucilaginibacter sp.]|uniref:DUF6364 family protein n=1 Tax=Mucilaginibacter sp. TaxID=1882438 RepID=UPI002621748F|nr:DUF6364 family protein [Mucilaginibacter sp.]MDB4922098.1 hypothetical protein [Mucilaginibacter sp.]
MKTRLTVTIKDSTIKKAKSYAKYMERNLSELVESHLETLIETHHEKRSTFSQIKKIAGVIKLPSGFDEEETISAYFQNKH